MNTLQNNSRVVVETDSNDKADDRGGDGGSEVLSTLVQYTTMAAVLRPVQVTRVSWSLVNGSHDIFFFYFRFRLQAIAINTKLVCRNTVIETYQNSLSDLLWLNRWFASMMMFLDLQSYLCWSISCWINWLVQRWADNFISSLIKRPSDWLINWLFGWLLHRSID